jgi:glycosyltransferase involved in cell wall biosynthesis
MMPVDSSKQNDSAVEQQLDFADAVADWFLSEAERSLHNEDVESALRKAHVGASVLTRQNRWLTCPRLEQLLQRIALRSELDAYALDERTARPHGRQVCLHVMEEALPAGGLTAMAVRWMENDSRDRIHCVALLAQQAPLPRQVCDAARVCGGEVWSPEGDASFVERAAWLRSLAARVADVVILHVGVSDTVFAAAFGRPGGPPVLLVNHAAHIFWVGSTIADVIVNCRGSDLEAQWSLRHRGAPATTVPIPLPSSNVHPAADAAEPDTANSIKASFGLPEDSLVLLTVGAGFKYGQTNRLDFVAVIERVLQQVAGVHLVAVGVVGDERWAAASARVDGRIHTLGPVEQSTLARLRSIAAVYVERFPFGTTTALLEAGLSGVPSVLAPAESPPPYGSDGVAIDTVLERPANVQAFENAIVSLLASSDRRCTLGSALAASIRAHHTGSGWMAHLDAALRMAPPVHAVRPVSRVEPTGVEIYRHWAEFIDQTDSPYAESLEHALVRAMLLDERPRFSRELHKVCLSFKSIRKRRGIAPPLLQAMLGLVLPLLPARVATSMFRTVAFLARGDVFAQVRSRLLAGRKLRRSGSWYEVYRSLGP